LSNVREKLILNFTFTHNALSEQLSNMEPAT